MGYTHTHTHTHTHTTLKGEWCLGNKKGFGQMKREIGDDNGGNVIKLYYICIAL